MINPLFKIKNKRIEFLLEELQADLAGGIADLTIQGGGAPTILEKIVRLESQVNKLISKVKTNLKSGNISNVIQQVSAIYALCSDTIVDYELSLTVDSPHLDNAIDDIQQLSKYANLKLQDNSFGF